MYTSYLHKYVQILIFTVLIQLSCYFCFFFTHFCYLNSILQRKEQVTILDHKWPDIRNMVCMYLFLDLMMFVKGLLCNKTNIYLYQYLTIQVLGIKVILLPVLLNNQAWTFWINKYRVQDWDVRANGWKKWNPNHNASTNYFSS